MLFLKLAYTTIKNQHTINWSSCRIATYQVADTELLEVLAEYFSIKLPADADISHIKRFLRKA